VLVEFRVERPVFVFRPEYTLEIVQEPLAVRVVEHVAYMRSVSRVAVVREMSFGGRHGGVGQNDPRVACELRLVQMGLDQCASEYRHLVDVCVAYGNRATNEITT